MTDSLQPEARGIESMDPRWRGLSTLIVARMLVLTLAMPIGVLLHPAATLQSWWVLWWSLLAVGGVSALFALGVRMQRGAGIQTALQVGADLIGVTLLAALTGGRESQFVLFYALVVLTAGLLARLPGGLVTAACAGIGFELLPWIQRASGMRVEVTSVTAVPQPELLLAFWGMVGVLAGVLGHRVQRARSELARTARELDRVRVDNDAILRHLTTGVLTVDGRGLVAYLNPAAEQVLAVRGLETRGRHIGTAFPDRLQAFTALVIDTLERRSPRARAELRLAGTTGRKLPLGISTNLLMHEGSVTGVVAVFQDLTEVREMERRARRNETLAEVGALAAGIAHELRNGLHPISGSVECLQRELKVQGENAVLMELVVRECGRLNRFVSELLAYSRDRDLILEDIELESHLAELRDQIARDPRCGSGVEVRFERRDLDATLHADRELIRQVWLNLAANALEAIGERGTLTLRWEPGEGDLVIVEFADTGGGIKPDDLKQVGRPFFTTKERGTGLGVAIAQRIVERHGGQLAFASTTGRGTSVRVALPGVVMERAQAA
jgi:two-component system sensor histidine kinase PilS (NtrC family)